MPASRKPLRRRPKGRIALERRNALAMAFHDAAVYRGYCAVCHVRPAHLHAHHCVEASYLRRELSARVSSERMDAIAYDPRNALGVCDGCHLNDHRSGSRRIHRQHIPESAWEFARELDALAGDERFTVRLEAYPS